MFRRFGADEWECAARALPGGLFRGSAIAVIAAARYHRPPLKPQNFDAWRRCEHLAEGVHPVTGLLRRTDAAVAELVELIESVSSTSNCNAGRCPAHGSTAPTAGRSKTLPRAASASRRMNSIARWRLTGSTS